MQPVCRASEQQSHLHAWDCWLFILQKRGLLLALLLITAVIFNGNIHMATVPNWMVRVIDFSLSLGELCLRDPLHRAASGAIAYKETISIV